MEYFEAQVTQPYMMPQTIRAPKPPRMRELEQRLSSLNKAAQTAESEFAKELAQARASRIEKELTGLRDDFAFKLWRRGLLRAELDRSTTRGEMRSFYPGEKPRRPKLEILTELSDCLRWLALWSDDPALIAEAMETKKELEAAYQNG